MNKMKKNLEKNSDRTNRMPILKVITLSLLIQILSLASPDTRACSTFQTFDKHNNSWVGKNFDWFTGNGGLFINSKGIGKTALIAPHSLQQQRQQPWEKTKQRTKPQTEPRMEQRSIPSTKITYESAFQWTSKWASLTFNQSGVDFALSGINERGLVVEVLVLGEEPWPKSIPDVPRMNEIQLVQYLLDRFENISEIQNEFSKVAEGKKWQLVPLTPYPLHYFVCDLNQCAAIENHKGTIQVFPSSKYMSLTNSPYLKSVQFLENFIGFGGVNHLPDPNSRESLSRFVFINEGLRQLTTQENNGTANSNWTSETIFNVLNRASVRKGINDRQHSTQWQIVYDRSSKIVHYKNLAHNYKLQQYDLNPTLFNRNCSGRNENVLFVSLKESNPLLNTKTKPLDKQHNDQMIEEFAIDYASIFPRPMIESIKNQYSLRKCISNN